MADITKKRLISISLAAIAMVGLAPLPAHGADSSSNPATAGALTVSPPTNEFTITPGQTVTTKINLTNTYNSPRDITPESQNFVASGEDGQAALSPEDGPFSLKQWISFSPNKATIKPGETKEFDIKIAVPSNGGPGGHFAAVVFNPSLDKNNGGGGSVKVQTSISSLILVTVPGAIKQNTSVSRFSTDKSFYQKGPIKYTTTFKNDGNVVIRPEGTITIYNIIGNKIATLKIDPQRVLPSSSRRFENTWKQKTLFGAYKAKIQWHYADQPTRTQTIKVWAAPLGTVGIGVAILVLLFIILWLPRKRLKKALKVLASSGGDS